MAAKKQGSYQDQFSMWPGGRGPGNLSQMRPGTGSSGAYLGPSAGKAFQRDTAQYGSPGGVGRLLGAAQGNVAYRQRINLVDGVVTKTSATDATLYEQQSIAGTFGFASGRTERFRNAYKSTGWKYQLTQSKGPNKGPHGFSQSSVDSTQEVYTTEETRFNNPGIYDTNEKWNPKTKRFERQWKGWKNLRVNKRWKHYTLSTATMFGAENKDVGAARRAKRKQV